jgi:hypothetical protein
MTMQHCIKTRKPKLCPRDGKKIGFARRYHAQDAPGCVPKNGFQNRLSERQAAHPGLTLALATITIPLNGMNLPGCVMPEVGPTCTPGSGLGEIRC